MFRSKKNDQSPAVGGIAPASPMDEKNMPGSSPSKGLDGGSVAVRPARDSEDGYDGEKADQTAIDAYVAVRSSLVSREEPRADETACWLRMIFRRRSTNASSARRTGSCFHW